MGSHTKSGFVESLEEQSQLTPDVATKPIIRNQLQAHKIILLLKELR